MPVPAFDTTSPDDEWIGALKRAGKLEGGFEAVEPLAGAVALAGIALRVPYKRLAWEARKERGSQASRRPTTMSISVNVAQTSANVIRMSLGQ